MKPVYLDYNGTTPVDPEVYSSMIPYLTEIFGNPSSTHFYGLQAKIAVEKARQQVAHLLNSKSEEIIFTSGGTEANNLAIRGYIYANREKGDHIITSVIEHPSVLEVCRKLEKDGLKVSYIPVDENGIVDTSAIEKAITPSTLLISIMHANNETGAIQPIEEIALIARKHHIAFHSDASQSAGKIQTHVDTLGVDLLTLAGHKLYAPKGIGALYVREGIKLAPISQGAAQEKGIKPGTENVKDIVAFGKAAEMAQEEIENYYFHTHKLTNDLFNKLKEAIPELRFNGHFTNRLPNTINISFKNILNGDLIRQIPEICLSAGAACHSADDQISYVLEAMNVPNEYSKGAIRISVGKMTTEAEIDIAANSIINAYQNLISDSKIKTDNTDNHLLEYTISPGCSCKINSESLDEILRELPKPDDSDVLVDAMYKDDAAVYRLSNETAIVQTLDFLTPMVNDPYIYGEIAAANAISDIYAMGAKPIYALNIVGFPSKKLSFKILEQILAGASNKAKEAGIFISGGHSVEDNEPKFGMAVTGLIHPDKILKNSTAQINDVIILTKPIGTGIISFASKLGVAGQSSIEKAIDIMKNLNDIILELTNMFEIHACTDVTGFGLSGHLHEMASGSELNAKISYSLIPIINGTEDLARAEILPAGTKENCLYAKNFVRYDAKISEYQKNIFSDAQTSGGLLLSISASEETALIEFLRNKGINEASCIGIFSSRGNGQIILDQ